ncbi:MAG: M23 family metallopeptidase [Polyangiales bacterium]
MAARINERRTLAALCAIAIAAGASAQSLPANSQADTTAAQSPAERLATLDRAISDADSEVERLDAQARRLSQEAEGLPAREQAVRERARRETRRMYHLRQGAFLALRGGPGSLLEHMSRVAHTRRSLVSSLDELDSVRRRSTELRAERERIEREKTATQQRRVDLAARRQQTELFGGSGSLGVAAVAPNVLGGSVTVYGGRGGDTASATFSESAGRLLLPIAGRAELRRVQREGAEGPGIEVRAAVGTPVRAVYPGRVAFSDRYGAFGRLVILDHGEHYYTVSGNLGTVAVRVGEELPAGAVLGTVGDEGQGAHLYFEVRHGSDTIDPMPWFGIQAPSAP